MGRQSGRTYQSPARQRQADETRCRIAAAARQLLLTHGYAGMTVDAIAKEAGVAAATGRSCRTMSYASVEEPSTDSTSVDVIMSWRRLAGVGGTAAATEGWSRSSARCQARLPQAHGQSATRRRRNPNGNDHVI